MNEPDTSVADAGMDAPTDGGTEDADAGVDTGCNPRRPPEKPDVADDDGERIVFALKDIQFDQRPDRWQRVGYDLDGVCTTLMAPTTLCVPPMNLAPLTDGEDGVDNALGRDIMAQIFTVAPTVELLARERMEQGQNAVIIRIDGWNHQDDDPTVTAVMGQSLRAERDDMNPLPQWDGADRWVVSSADFADDNENMPSIADDLAYVRDRVLVMKFPDRSPITFPWTGNVLQVKLTDMVLTGRISEDEQMLEEVIMAGRWSLTDMAMSLTQAGICPLSSERILLDSALQRAADIRSDPGTGGDGVICDAISAGLGMTGYVALWQGLDRAPDEPAPCP